MRLFTLFGAVVVFGMSAAAGATPKADGPGDPAARLLLTPIACATIAERSTGERHG
jgi:hypothetical protein